MLAAKLSTSAFLAMIYLAIANAQSNPLPRPGMGFNGYNAFACSPTDANSRSSIDALISGGYKDAGYNFFQIDCGWVAKTTDRDSNGNLQIDTTAFPNGLRVISDYATSKGLDFAMYSDAGVRLCDTTTPSGRLGSLGHEDADAQLFKSLNASYVKYDNCYADGPNADQNAPKTPRTDFPTRFNAMKSALDKVGITKYLSCTWGVPQSTNNVLQGPAVWTQNITTSYRLSDDIVNSWGDITRILNQAIHITKYNQTGPGHFADADLLEVGNSGLTIAEQQSHFAYWAMIKSPLVISTDLTKISSDAKAILLNKGLIAVNQDSLGRAVQLVERRTNNYDLYQGPLSGGQVAVLAIDMSNAARTLTINFADLGIQSADVLDLWSGATTTGATSVSRSLAAHGSIALRLSNVKTASSSSSLTYVEAESGTLGGNAAKASCSGCSGSTKVGYIGNGGTLTFSNIRVPSSEAVIQFDYINCEVGYSFTGATNDRKAQISVNGGTAQNVSFPLSGYNWDGDVYKSYKVRLTGFNPSSTNTIAISNPNAYAPDIDRIGY